MKDPIRVAVTGGAGQISYSLLFRLAHGDAFGPDQPVILQIIEVPEAMGWLRGVQMELEDCAFPLLHSTVLTDDPNVGFRDVDWAILVGGLPRTKDMQRKDLLQVNGKIFMEHGRAINDNAAADVRVLVVANPCNTNALVAQRNAPRIPADHWFAMTRLDENRAKAQIAQKAGVPVSAVTNMAIWGNHSDTQFPNFEHARIAGKPLLEVIPDRAWLENDFLAINRDRGRAVIEARGKSSAASAANAAIDTLRSLSSPTPPGDWFSVAVRSDGSYGIPEGLIYSFPLRCCGKGDSYQIVQGLEISDFARARLQASVDELLEEREAVADLLS